MPAASSSRYSFWASRLPPSRATEITSHRSDTTRTTIP
ncbi:YqzL-like protein, partial [Dysosmobacter welbionis]